MNVEQKSSREAKEFNMSKEDDTVLAVLCSILAAVSLWLGRWEAILLSLPRSYYMMPVWLTMGVSTLVGWANTFKYVKQEWIDLYRWDISVRRTRREHRGVSRRLTVMLTVFWSLMALILASGMYGGIRNIKLMPDTKLNSGIQDLMKPMANSIASITKFTGEPESRFTSGDFIQSHIRKPMTRSIAGITSFTGELASKSIKYITRSRGEALFALKSIVRWTERIKDATTKSIARWIAVIRDVFSKIIADWRVRRMIVKRPSIESVKQNASGTVEKLLVLRKNKQSIIDAAIVSAIIAISISIIFIRRWIRSAGWASRHVDAETETGSASEMKDMSTMTEIRSPVLTMEGQSTKDSAPEMRDMGTMTDLVLFMDGEDVTNRMFQKSGTKASGQSDKESVLDSPASHPLSHAGSVRDTSMADSGSANGEDLINPASSNASDEKTQNCLSLDDDTEVHTGSAAVKLAFEIAMTDKGVNIQVPLSEGVISPIGVTSAGGSAGADLGKSISVTICNDSPTDHPLKPDTISDADTEHNAKA